MSKYEKTPDKPRKKRAECPCLQLRFRAGHDWKDPQVLRRGKRIQRFGQLRAYELQIQTRVWVELTCANNPPRTCSGAVECKVARSSFTDKNGVRLLVAGAPIVVPASQGVTNDCDGKAKNLQTGFTVVFFFVTGPQANRPPPPRPPGVGVTDLIINGDIELEFKLTNCPGPPGIPPPGTWKMKLKIKGSNLDVEESDYDGDGKKNKDEGAPGDSPQDRRKKMFSP